jgi:CRISPR/Cas system-associated endonuclease Cas3-HD
MESRIDIIYDLVKKIDEKQDLQCERLTRLECLSEKNTKDLEEHIEGVKQTRLLINKIDLEHKQRIEKLETPFVTFKNLSKYIIFASTLIGSIFALLKYFKISFF